MGWFSPTEGAGVGAAMGLMLAIVKGITKREIIDTILQVGKTSAPILLLLLTASLYSRTLAMTGVQPTQSYGHQAMGATFFQQTGIPQRVNRCRETVMDKVIHALDFT